jgi:sugar phosphate isomerase/epimerase
MIKEVDSPNLKACLDAPILEDKNKENMMEAAKAVKGIQMLSHFGGEFGEDDNGSIVDIQDHSDHPGKEEEQKAELYLPHFVNAMKEIGYHGWYSYELCHPLPVLNGEKVGIDFVDMCARNACKMMKGLVANS